MSYYQQIWTHIKLNEKQEAHWLGAHLDKMADNDHIKLDNIEI